MNKKLFITTTFADVAKELKEAGFKLVEQQNGKWVFLNDRKFSASERGKVVETNILSF